MTKNDRLAHLTIWAKCVDLRNWVGFRHVPVLHVKSCSGTLCKTAQHAQVHPEPSSPVGAAYVIISLITRHWCVFVACGVEGQFA